MKSSRGITSVFFLPYLKSLRLSRKATRAQQKKSSALRIESLEDRTVPTTLTVGVGRQFATITDALAVAPANALIYVYPGTYSEAVTISQNGIRLVAAQPGVIIQPTTVTPVTLDSVNVGGAAIDIYAKNVVINGLTVDGSQDSDTNLWAGIRVLEGGTATIENNTVEGMLFGNPNSNIGIQVGTSLVTDSQGAGTATIIQNTIINYAGAGVLVDGANAAASVQFNIIHGIGTANNGVPEYGVQVSNLAIGTVKHNTIVGNTIQGNVPGGYNPSPTSAGVFFYNEGLSKAIASVNTIKGNDDGILVEQSNAAQMVSNSITGNFGYAGIVIQSSNNAVIVSNTVFNNSTLNGIALNSSSSTQLNSNTIYGNINADGIYDFQGSNNYIAYNYTYSNGNNGINIDTSVGDQLYSNGSTRNAFNGIQVTGGSDNTVWLSNCSHNVQDGILFIDTTGNVALKNTLNSNGGYGLQLEDAQNSNLDLNSVASNTTGSISIDSESTGTTQMTIPQKL